MVDEAGSSLARLIVFIVLFVVIVVRLLDFDNETLDLVWGLMVGSCAIAVVVSLRILVEELIEDAAGMVCIWLRVKLSILALVIVHLMVALQALELALPMIRLVEGQVVAMEGGHVWARKWLRLMLSRFGTGSLAEERVDVVEALVKFGWSNPLKVLLNCSLKVEIALCQGCAR